MILLPRTPRSSAEKVVERIQATCVGLRVGPIRLGISLGIATMSSADERMADVLRAADEAMYRAKKGRNDS